MGFFSKISENLTLMQAMFAQTGALQPQEGAEASSGPSFDISTASSLRQASHRCMRCSQTEACRKWLNIGFETEAENDDGFREPPSFCPNQELQQRMAAKH